MRPILLGAALALMAGAALAAEGWQWSIPDWLPPPPVPDENPMTAEKVELGRHLFHDARLSADGTVACASCHVQAMGFADGRAVGIGIAGTVGLRNAPGLANVAYLPVLTWGNPMLDSLERHALIPMFGTAPVEMGSAGIEAELFNRLAADPFYARAFPAAFPDRPAPDLYTITRALAAFERRMISAGSPYDRFAYEGDRDALSAAARRGQDLFFGERLECYHCHGGFNFTDNLVTSRMKMAETGFHNTGVHDVVLEGGEGIAAFTLREADVGRFRTPSLRNVAVTAPYMHDGSMATLSEVLDAYANGGRHPGVAQKDPLVAGFALSPGEKADVIAFLESLTDEGFLTDPALSDPWPAGHPAVAQRVMPCGEAGSCVAPLPGG